MVPSLQIEACDIFLVVEGLFLTLAKHFEDHEGDPSGHGAPSSKKLLPRYLNMLITHTASSVFGNEAKESSNHLRQVTGNKSWKAGWMRRVSDMLANFRTQWDSSRVQNLSKLFLVEWDSPLPRSQGVCFRDVYLNANWEETDPRPESDCYMRAG